MEKNQYSTKPAVVIDTDLSLPYRFHSPNTVPPFRTATLRSWLFLLGDFAVVWIGVLAVLNYKFAVIAGANNQPAGLIQAHVVALMLYSVLLALFLHTQGLHSAHQTASMGQELIAITKAVVLAAMVEGIFFYASGLKNISPLTVGLTVLWSLLSILTWRILRRYFARRAAPDGVTCHNVLIIGTDRMAQALGTHLISNRELGFHLLGFVANHNSETNDNSHLPTGVIGTLSDLPKICQMKFVDEIFVCGQQQHVVKLIVENARECGVGVRVLPNSYEGAAWEAHLDFVGAFPTLYMVQRKVPTIQVKLKRLIDVVVSGLALIAFAPLMAAIAILVKIDSRGPVFYVSQRVGRKGRVFDCYKFRTMVTNAEELKSKLEHLNERHGILFKITDDPRVTTIGRKLRKYSLDELAQLWNVLKGDMSLVGPRPPLASEVKQYELEYYRRLEASPGITGLWQVEARTSPRFQDYIELDLTYVNTWSIGLDLKILFRTIAVVWAGTGS